ncbi:hypothetical protein AGMMS50229_10070 [Campylobacterota bacterium]|nr:hypothetical protein AGMMS50229_10070 [Campylobacterota bacterium]
MLFAADRAGIFGGAVGSPRAVTAESVKEAERGATRVYFLVNDQALNEADAEIGERYPKTLRGFGIP